MILKTDQYTEPPHVLEDRRITGVGRDRRVLPSAPEIIHVGNMQKVRIIDLPKISDPRGNLTFIEANFHVPFAVERVYYLYDVPGGETRGGHAHRQLEQLIIAAAGSFDVVVDDGYERKKFSLNRSYYGLYIPHLVWRDLENFSSGSVCLVLASQHFAESDYYRDYAPYLADVRRSG